MGPRFPGPGSVAALSIEQEPIAHPRSRNSCVRPIVGPHVGGNLSDRTLSYNPRLPKWEPLPKGAQRTICRGAPFFDPDLVPVADRPENERDAGK
jgi:hypothetical protein